MRVCPDPDCKADISTDEKFGLHLARVGLMRAPLFRTTEDIPAHYVRWAKGAA